jgi:hypothetical protein
VTASPFPHARAEHNLVVAAAFLTATGARFVVIGGCALLLHGVDHHPPDLDIVPHATAETLGLLFDGLDALGSVGATRRPNVHRLAAHDVVTHTTPIGSVDLLLLTGRNEFAVLDRRAVEIAVDGHPVRVAALDDVVRLRQQFGKDPVDV